MLRLQEFEYLRPARLDQAVELLHGADGALPVAGGTDLVPNLKHRLFTPRRLVALKGVEEMCGVAYLSADGEPLADTRAGGASELSIGACESLAGVARHPLVNRHFPSLAAAAGLVAGPQIRNQGTLGGNLCLDTRCTYYNQTYFWRQALGFCLKKDGDVCHVTKVGKKCVAAHSADTPPVLITLRAVADLVSAGGERSVPVADFFVADGVWNSVRRPDELVRRIRLPLPGPGFRAGYQKLRQRNSIDFPLLSIAVAVELGDDTQVRSIRVVVSGLGARPRLVSGLDKVVGGRLDEVIDQVAGIAHRQSRPLQNAIVDTEWRRAMVPVYVRRALRGIAA
ncbi:MAG: FAD binding domain-containing protein [Longimicrobiaceae bacterium]